MDCFYSEVFSNTLHSARMWNETQGLLRQQARSRATTTPASGLRMGVQKEEGVKKCEGMVISSSNHLTPWAYFCPLYFSYQIHTAVLMCAKITEWKHKLEHSGNSGILWCNAGLSDTDDCLKINNRQQWLSRTDQYLLWQLWQFTLLWSVKMVVVNLNRCIHFGSKLCQKSLFLSYLHPHTRFHTCNWVERNTN